MLTKSNEQLNIALEMHKQPRIASTNEHLLVEAQNANDLLQKEVDRLKNALLRSDNLSHYLHNLFTKPSLFSNVYGKFPGLGLFCRVLIKKAHS